MSTDHPMGSGADAGMATELGVVDSHVHLWDPERLRYRWLDDTALDRRIDADDLRAAADPVGTFVLVQGDCADDQGLAEVEWLTEQAHRLPAVLGVVAHAPLHRGGRAADHLAALRDHPSVVGIRRLIQGEPAGFCADPDFRAGVGMLTDTGLAFDVCVRADQLAEATDLVAATPGVQFVLDHLGKPAIGAGPTGDAAWRADLSRLAALPNVAVKLSGLTSEVLDGPAEPALLRPYLRYGLEAFGPQRCLFGSDWPVLTLTGDHASWLALVTDVVTEVAPDALDRVLVGNAHALYRTSPAATSNQE